MVTKNYVIYIKELYRYNKCKYSHESHIKDIGEAILTIAIFVYVPKGYEIHNRIPETCHIHDEGDW